jgi:TRAP-type C4-dicarboxylate transport system substrate-binding protein
MNRIRFSHFDGNSLALECGLRLVRWLTSVLVATLAIARPAAAADEAQMTLRVVGGLGELNQFTRHEAPFWTRDLARLSKGRYTAQIVPFDRAGIRGQELLSMVRLGTVPFGTLLVSLASPKDAELAAPDLAGLNPDAQSLRRAVAAFRPRLAALLRERHDVELLAVYVYPAQALFCAKPISSLAGVRGLRVRTSSVSQSDWVEALGGFPVTTPFSELVTNLKAGNVDCAITGTMSGNTIGLQDLTTHLHTMAINWGLAVFVAHGSTWRTLPPDLRDLLQLQLPKLEAAIWDEAIRETDEGIACNVGAPTCAGGRKGRMVPVRSGAADEAVRRDILSNVVLPRWVARCGTECAETWNRYLAPTTGVQARTP